MNIVFVYGTLKYGFSNHCVIKGSRFVCDAVTDKPYLLFASGIPFMVNDSNDFNSVRVSGEVYDVSDETLGSLDVLEGHPRFYKRESIWVINTKTNIKIYAFAYFINSDFFQLDHCEVLKDGVYSKPKDK